MNESISYMIAFGSILLVGCINLIMYVLYKENKNPIYLAIGFFAAFTIWVYTFDNLLQENENKKTANAKTE